MTDGLPVDKMLSVVKHSWEPDLSGSSKIGQHLLCQWEKKKVKLGNVLEWNNNTSEKKKKKSLSVWRQRIKGKYEKV